MDGWMDVCMYVCMYVCICVCVCVYIYILWSLEPAAVKCRSLGALWLQDMRTTLDPNPSPNALLAYCNPDRGP